MNREHDEHPSGTLIEEFLHASDKLEFGLVLDILASHAVGERTGKSLREAGMLESTERAERSRLPSSRPSDCSTGERIRRCRDGSTALRYC